MIFEMKKIWLVALLAILVRILLASISFHPDIQAFNVGGWVVSRGHLLDFYDYIARLPKDDPIAKNYPASFFIYPPAVYFFHGVFAYIFSVIPGFSSLGNFLFDVPKFLGSWQLNLHLLLLKLPYVIFDLPIAFLLARFFESKKDRILAMVFWLFNPVNLYVTYLMGQFDIIPTFFVVLSLYLLMRKDRILSLRSNILAAAALGLGASFKIYPLFFLVPLASLENHWKGQLKVLIFGGLVYLLTILPFLPSPGFRASALVSDLTLKSLYPQIPVSGGESILIFLALLIIFYLIFLGVKTEVKMLWQRFFIVLLLFFTFTHYHPQWFLWITPFLILALIRSNFKEVLPVVLSLASFVALLFFFDPSLTLGLFSPIYPQLYTIPSIWQILHINIDYNFSRSILQTLFAGSAFYLIYRYFPKKVDSLS